MVFGAFDGLTSVLGVLFALTGHQQLIVPTALGVALAEGVGMTAGQWLAEPTSRTAALTIGAATALGAFIPATPWIWLTGGPALIAATAIIAAQSAVITILRRHERGTLRAITETTVTLILVTAVVYGVEHFTPTGH